MQAFPHKQGAACYSLGSRKACRTNEKKMSKTIRNERTRGFLDKLQRSRKERKEARDLKADELFNIDFLFQELTPAQESQL